MDRLIADTHAIVWHLTAPRKLGGAARRQFEAADGGRTLCCVPAIALVEIALLHERGRLPAGRIDHTDRRRVSRGRLDTGGPDGSRVQSG
jgi:PIN domain nuclease of toxin-antitoxin system